MEETQVRILSIQGDQAIVEPLVEGCGHCHEPGGCGGSAVSRGLCVTPRQFGVHHPGGFCPGDRVVVGLPPGVLLWTALVTYGAPLLGLIVGAVLGSLAAGAWFAPGIGTENQYSGEWLSIIAGGVGVWGGWACLPYLESRMRCSLPLEPRIIRRI